MIMRKLIYIICLAAILVVTGCNKEQVIQALHRLETINDAYCSADNENERKVLITAAHMITPLYPDGGICEVENKAKLLIELVR